MKRCLVPLTSFLLVAALTACGSSGNQGTTQTTTEEAEVSTQTTEDTDKDLEETDSSSVSTPEDDKDSDNISGTEAVDDASDEAQATEEEEAFERGTIDGNTYRNEFFSFSYTLPEDHQFATEEQLAQLANVTTDMLEDEASTKALEEGRVLYDMYAYGLDGQNVSLTIEKVNAMTGVLVSLEKYREICVSKFDEQLAGTGMEVVECEDATFRIGDTDYLGENVVLTYQGQTIYEKIMFLKNGSFFGLVTAAGPSFEATEELLSHCSAI